MNLIQKLRRLRQKFRNSGWDIVFQTINAQLPIVQKLYIRHGLTIQITCYSCPEQYEVFRGEKQVAYYRLRHGSFRVDYPECCGETIYEAEPDGDGAFESYERFNYLSEAMHAVLKRIESE